jgi:trimeric autotransporter adhesin
MNIDRRASMLLRIRWLLVVVLLALGCGGRAVDGDLEADAGRDAPADRNNDITISPPEGGASPDRAAPMPDAPRDARDGGIPDAGVDRGTMPDVSSDARDAAVDRRDTTMDASADITDAIDNIDVPPPIDGRAPGADAPPAADAEADAGDDVADARPSDAVVDAVEDCTLACGLVGLVVTPVNPVIIDWCTQAMRSTGIYADGTTLDLTAPTRWRTSNASTAVVSNAAGKEGIVTAMGAGSVTITAELAGLTANTSVTVTSGLPVALAITPPASSLAQGFSLPFVATVVFNDGVTSDVTSQVLWSSGFPSTASIGADGVALGLAPGTTTIAAVLGSLTASMSLTVTSATLVGLTIAPASSTLPVGTVKRLMVTGQFSDGSAQDLTTLVSWNSLDPTRATVSDEAGSKGRVTAVAGGTATITATLGIMAHAATVDVSTASLQSISTSMLTRDLALRMTLPLQAIGLYSDGSNVDLTDVATWSSPDSSIATVRGSMVTGKSEGQVWLSVSFAGVTGSTPVTVRAARLVAVSLVPADPNVSPGASTPVRATGTYSDGVLLDLTELAGWISSDPSVAAISNIAGRRGILTGLWPGTSAISVSYACGGAAATAIVSP